MTEQAELNAALNDLVTKGGGMLKCVLVDPDMDIMTLIGDAANGHPLAPGILAAVSAFGLDLLKPSAEPRLCLLCPTPLKVRNTERYVVLLCDDGTAARVAMGLCPDCAARGPRVIEDVVLKLRDIWPDLRRIEIHPNAGHA